MELFNVDSFKRQNGKVIGVAFQMHKAQKPWRIYQNCEYIYNQQSSDMNYKYVITYQDKSWKSHSFNLKATKQGDLYFIVEPDNPIEKEIFNKIPDYIQSSKDFI